MMSATFRDVGRSRARPHQIGERFSLRGHVADLVLLIAAAIVVAFAIWVILGSNGLAKAGPASTPLGGASKAATSTTASAKPKAAKTAKTLTAVFIGDSYTVGAGGDGTKWTTLLAKLEGWREVNLGYRGTGYGKEFHAPDCPENGCPNFLQVVDQVVAKNPDVVVVSGGRNDISSRGVAAGNIPQIFKQLRGKLPNAKIIAVSPFWGSGSYPSSLTAIGSDVRTAVESQDSGHSCLMFGSGSLFEWGIHVFGG